MISRTTATFLKVGGICAVAAIGFVLLHEPMRAAEAAISVRLLNVLGFDDIHGVGRTTLLVIPAHRAAFHVLITPSCSSIASVLAFGCLAPLVPSRTSTGRIMAVSATALLIIAGNIVRITASIATGLVAGRGSLILFHDWVGSMFTVVYTLVGYILLLSFLLPERSRVPDPIFAGVVADAR